MMGMSPQRRLQVVLELQAEAEEAKQLAAKATASTAPYFIEKARRIEDRIAAILEAA